MKGLRLALRRIASAWTVGLSALAAPCVLVLPVTVVADTCAYVATVPLTVIDVGTNAIAATVSGVDGARGIALSPDGSQVYLSHYAGSVSIVDTATAAITQIAGVGTSLIGITVDASGQKVYVANFIPSGSISVIETAMNTVAAAIPVSAGPYGLAVSPDGDTLYVTHQVYHPGFVSVVDTATNAVTGTIPVGWTPEGVVFAPDGLRAYVTNYWGQGPVGTTIGTVSVIDTVSKTAIATIPIAGNPNEGLAISPDGTRLYVTSGNVYVIDTGTNEVIATIPDSFDAQGVAFTPDGAYAYVTHADSDSILVVDTATNAVVGNIAGGSASVGSPSIVVGSVPLGCQPGLMTSPTPTPSETPTASPTPICATTPLLGCRISAASRLRIRYAPSSREIVWTWVKGAATDFASLGNPVSGSTTYAACIYDTKDGLPDLVLSALIPAAGGWRAIRARGFQYQDPSGAADGITRLDLRTGDQGKAKVKLKGSGANLPPISPSDPNHLLSQDPTATFQLVNSDGQCWEAIFPSPARRLATDLFRDEF